MFSVTCITLFPELYTTFFKTSIIKKAIDDKQLINAHIVDVLSLSEPKKRIDSPIIGGGSGMLLGVETIEKAYNTALLNHTKKPYTIFFSPHGKKLDQVLAKKIYQDVMHNHDGNVITFAGRYEGCDARAEEEYADIILSVGDYVCMGGDVPALITLEVLLRFLPGVVGKQESVENDSFESSLLDAPHFANPDSWHEKTVPAVLKSGNHGDVDKWRYRESLKRTVINRFDWWRIWESAAKERVDVKKIIPNHYVILMHNDIMLPHGISGESSVTSIDIHDNSRSSATYGIKNYFLVTRLPAQKAIVDKFLAFWDHGEGKEYNEQRSFALSRTRCCAELAEALDAIKELENGLEPLTIVTSSRREIPHERMITFHDQEKIWTLQRPVVFILGTAHGLAPFIMDGAHYRLVPLEGMEEFNFLSVRSAAAIILDRWLGINVKYKK